VTQLGRQCSARFIRRVAVQCRRATSSPTDALERDFYGSCVGRSVGRDDRSNLFVGGFCLNLVSRIWSWSKSRPGRFRSVSVVCRKLTELMRIDAPGGLPSATRAASAATSPSSSEHQRCYSLDTRLVSKPTVWSASWSCLEGQVFVFVSVSRINVWDQSQGQVSGMAFDLRAKVSRSRPVLKPRYRSGISATDLTVRLRLSLPLEGVVLFDITGSYETCVGSTCSEICCAQLRPGKATSSSSSAHQ